MIACAAVVLCDLAFGLRRSWIMGEQVRFSRACRNTMGKLVTYASFVIMVCFVNTAAGGALAIDKWACLLVCFIEGCSILANLLKPKGVSVDLGKVLTALFAKATGVKAEDVGGAFYHQNTEQQHGN